MLPSSLPLPASFFKVLPLSQKFNRFRFHLPGTGYTSPFFPNQLRGPLG